MHRAVFWQLTAKMHYNISTKLHHYIKAAAANHPASPSQPHLVHKVASEEKLARHMAHPQGGSRQNLTSSRSNKRNKNRKTIFDISLSRLKRNEAPINTLQEFTVSKVISMGF